MTTTTTTVTTFGVHTRTRYGVYNFVGTFPTEQLALIALAAEVRKGIMATAWIRREGDELTCLWDHEFDTLADADKWASAF